jgi:hypothetical protein
MKTIHRDWLLKQAQEGKLLGTVLNSYGDDLGPARPVKVIDTMTGSDEFLNIRAFEFKGWGKAYEVDGYILLRTIDFAPTYKFRVDE